MERSTAKTIRTPAAPPRVGRSRWEMILAFAGTTFSNDVVTYEDRREGGVPTLSHPIIFVNNL
jgi:hypothetical protein